MNDEISSYYDECAARYGNDVASVGWFSRDTQSVRFNVLATMADFSGCSVLDVGCGLGDLYKYLNDNYTDIEYTGIDLSLKMCKQARRNYPYATIICGDFESFGDFEQFDYVVASGAFNIRVADNYKYLENEIEKMWGMCHRGLAFNVLSRYTTDALVDDFFFYYRPEKIFSMCMNLSHYVIVRHDYLPNDVTFIIYKSG